MIPLLALVLVTAIWGVTFVQVKDAVAIYPLFAFLAVRFAIASVTLAPFSAGRFRGFDRRGLVAGVCLGGLLALGYALQTAGLERTTVSSTGFITGLCVVLTPITAFLLFRDHIPAAVWVGVGLSTFGLAMLFGIEAGSTAGDVLVLGGAAAYALQIVLLERFAPDYDPVAFTLVEMLAACLGFTAIALARGELSVPHGWTVWGALLVTGIFASAFAFLVQTWAQRELSATRTALVFAAEPVFAGRVVLTPITAYALFRDRIPVAAWLGVALSTIGLGLLFGIEAGSSLGDLLVLGGALAYALQIVLLEGYAPHYDPVAFTLVEMVAASLGFTAIALVRGELSIPHGWTLWGALLVTGVFASAFAFLVQTWAQRELSATRVALVFALEPVFAGLAGFLLAGDRLGVLGWGGCALILAGIVISEPAAAQAFRTALRRAPT